MNIIAEITPTNPIVQYPDQPIPPMTILQNGWTPVLSNVVRTNTDGTKDIVQKVADWFGGLGPRPEINIYLSESGFTRDISEATIISSARYPKTDDDIFSI